MSRLPAARPVRAARRCLICGLDLARYPRTHLKLHRPSEVLDPARVALVEAGNLALAAELGYRREESAS